MFSRANVNQKNLYHISKPTFVNSECKYSNISPFLRTFADDFNKICEMTEQREQSRTRLSYAE